MKKGIFFYIVLSVIVISFIAALSYLRSERFSDRIKGMLVPELERLTGAEVEIGSISLTPFPTYFEIHDLKIRGKDGRETLSLKRCRIFLNPGRLLVRELYLTRIELKDLYINAPLERIPLPLSQKTRIGNNYIIKIVPVEVILDGGRIQTWRNSERLTLAEPSLSLNLRKGYINIKRLGLTYGTDKGRGLSINMKGRLRYSDRGGTIEIKALAINDKYSKIRLKGTYRKKSFQGSISGHLSSRSIPPAVVREDKLRAELDLNGSFGLGKLDMGGDLMVAVKTLTYDLELKGYTDLQLLMKILKEREPLYGRAMFKGRLRGSYLSPRLALTASMDKGSIYGVDTDGLQTEIQYRDGMMTFSNSLVHVYNGTAEVEVKIALPVVNWYSLSVAAKGLDSRALLKLIKFDPGLPSGKVRGHLLSEGRRFSPSGRFIFESSSANDGEGLLNRIRHIEGNFYLRDNRLRLDDLKVASDSTLITSRGTINLQQKDIRLDFLLKTEDLGEFIEAFSGRAEAEGSVTGKTTAPLIAGIVNAGDFRIADIPLGDTRARLSYQKGVIRIHSFVGAMHQGQLTMKGKIETGSTRPFVFKKPRLMLDLRFSSIPLVSLSGRLQEGIIKDLKGHLKGDARITGHPGSPMIEGSVESDDLRYRETPLGRLRSKFIFSRGHYLFKDLSLKKGQSMIKGSFAYADRGGLEIRDGQIILSSRDLPVRLKKEILLRADISAFKRNNSPRLSLSGTLVSASEEIGRIEIRYLQDALQISSDLLGGMIRIKGRLVPDTLSWNLEFQASSGRYERLLGYFMDVPREVLLNVSASARLQGRGVEEINGSVRFNRLVYNLYGYSFTNIGDILLSVQKNNISVESFRMKAGPATFNLTGNVTTSGEINITAYGTSYLTPLKTLIKGIESIRGDVDFVLALTGTLKEPLINGGLLINDTSIELTYFVERIKNVTGYAYIDNNRVVVETLKGNFGGGEITMVGSAYLKKWHFSNYNMDLTLNNVSLKPLEGVWFTSKGQLTLSEQKGTPMLVGNLVLSRARFKRDINWRTMILSRRAAPGNHKAISGHLELNITITGEDDILIDNNLVTAPVKIDLLLKGTPSRPVLLGRIEFRGGKFFFRNNEFLIEKASADFVDPEGIYPFFDVLASTRVHDYNISLRLTGYIDEFNLTLTSTPYLNEMDILSLLTTRRIARNLRGLEGGIGVAEATAFLTGQLQDTIEERLQSITGFDRVEVEPYISDKTGEIGPRVTVAKRLLSDRLYVTYSTSFGSEAEQFIKLEFKLSDSVLLVGERDETGTIGADIKFRWEFR